MYYFRCLFYMTVENSESTSWNLYQYKAYSHEGMQPIKYSELIKKASSPVKPGTQASVHVSMQEKYRGSRNLQDTILQ